MSSIPVLLVVILALALVTPLILSSFNENKHRIPKPKLPGRSRSAFRQFPLDDE